MVYLGVIVTLEVILVGFGGWGWSVGSVVVFGWRCYNGHEMALGGVGVGLVGF